MRTRTCTAALVAASFAFGLTAPRSALAVDANEVTYTPDVSGDWIPTVSDVAAALDQLVSRILSLEEEPDHPVVVFSTWTELENAIADLAASTTSDGATFMLEQGKTLTSSASPVAFDLDLSASGLEGKKVIVDGGGGTLDYTGTAANVTVLHVESSDVWNGIAYDIEIRNWSIRNTTGNATGLIGVRHSGGSAAFLFDNLSVTGDGFHTDGSGARAFVIDGYTYVTNIRRALFSSAGAIVSTDGNFDLEYSNEIRDSILGEAWRSESGVAEVGPCIDMKASDAFANKPFPATLHTAGVHYYGCDGITIDGLHWFSTGDLFDTPRFETPGDATSGWNAWFTVGGTDSGNHTNVDIRQGAVINLRNASGKVVHFQGDFQSFRADLQTVRVAREIEQKKCQDWPLFQADGVLFDAASGVEGEYVSATIEVHDDTTTDEACFVGENDPSQFITSNARTMLADSMNGAVTGRKQNYLLFRDQVYLSSGVHQLSSDAHDDGSSDDGTGNRICAGGGGLDCVDVAKISGASQQGFASTPSARCAHTFSPAETIDVTCQ